MSGNLKARHLYVVKTNNGKRFKWINLMKSKSNPKRLNEDKIIIKIGECLSLKLS